MIKFIVCIAIVIFSLLVGNEIYGICNRRVKAINELKEIVSDVIILVDFMSLDVFDICGRVFKNRKYIDSSAFFNITNGDFPAMWENACMKSLRNANEEDKNAFCEIGYILGSCDSKSQIKKLSQIEKALERSYAEKKHKLEDTKKLYYIISLCIGMVTCLVIV